MITSSDNDRLKRVRKLLSGRKHRDGSGLFACEGEDLVAAATAACVEPVDLLVAGENVAPDLLASLSTLPHPARVIGVYRRADLPTTSRPVVLALCNVGDPGNVGTLIRSADAFGACAAISAGCADPLGPKALRASVGAIFRVPLVPFEELPERRIALVARGGTPLEALDLTPPVALLLGSERDGVPEHLVSISHTGTIRTTGEGESLNVAAAGAIALYELSRRASSG